MAIAASAPYDLYATPRWHVHRWLFACSLLLAIAAGVAFRPLAASSPSLAPGAPAQTLAVGVSQPQTTPCASAMYRLPSVIPSDTEPNGLYVSIDPESHYPIHGSTVDEIADQMALCTPISQNGQRFGANTGYTMSSNYRYTINGSQCRVTGAVVTLHINQMFPAWHQDNASADITARWQTFNTNVHTHEQGHIDIDKSYAAQLYQGLLALPPETCSRLTADANGLTERIEGNLNQANNDYDAITNHGATQGAVIR